MTVTVGANGLSVVHQGSGGEASADSPDVCATTVGKSTVNIAYGNSAKSSDLADGSTTVTMDGGNSVALRGSTFSKSTGDEGGDKKGVSSGTIQGEAAFTSASPTVKIEGQGVARQSDSMTMNSGNTLCSGVQNPSFQIGTPEPETYSVNIYCENLANAPFKVKDGDGNIVASGELNGAGKCTLDPLPENMCLEVEYEENPNEFNWGPGPVDFNQRYGELSNDAFFSLAAGSQYPFWLRKPNSRAEQYQWGILGCQIYPNETLQSIIELEAKYLSSQLFTYWDAEEFAISLLKVMNKEPMEQKDVRYFVSQLLCIASPNISTSIYADAVYSFIWLDASTSYGELWANLRYFGRGNPQKAWDSLDWSAAAQHINKVADAFFERFLSRLECIKGNASLMGYSEVEKVTLGHIDTVKRVRKQLIDETQILLDNTKAKIQGIIDKGGDKPPVVKRPNQIVASAYDLNDKLYIKEPKLDKPKISREVIKEYIAIIGGQNDNGANKMMFAAQAVRYMRQNISKKEHNYTFLLVTTGYSALQIKLISSSCDKYGIALVKVSLFSEISNYINNLQDTLVEKLMIFSHGLPFNIELGYKLGNENKHINELSMNIETYKQIKPTSFSSSAKIESYACRTGMGNPSDFSVADVTDYLSSKVLLLGASGIPTLLTLQALKAEYGIHKVEEAFQFNPMPELSLAQLMADYFQVPVTVFITRTDYAATWGSVVDRIKFKVCDVAVEVVDEEWCDYFEKKADERSDLLKDSNITYNVDGALNDISVGMLSTPLIIGESKKEFIPR
ncbi:DUF4150 domain-containing protein [Aliivibrio fischeri]|uniref:DUF4150 domain-containing protein n=1 Tax=Aliivibrio fischeri TaxID=668 RepID=UPI0007C5920C|nr:DUF4150 domain-containing protein [Aliivibrio fischeri]MBP3139514.1 DUF4150 domain-containing protein [Aliivibrio fischeri]